MGAGRPKAESSRSRSFGHKFCSAAMLINALRPAAGFTPNARLPLVQRFASDRPGARALTLGKTSPSQIGARVALPDAEDDNRRRRTPASVSSNPASAVVVLQI